MKFTQNATRSFGSKVARGRDISERLIFVFRKILTNEPIEPFKNLNEPNRERTPIKINKQKRTPFWRVGLLTKVACFDPLRIDPVIHQF